MREFRLATQAPIQPRRNIIYFWFCAAVGYDALKGPIRRPFRRAQLTLTVYGGISHQAPLDSSSARSLSSAYLKNFEFLTSAPKKFHATPGLRLSITKLGLFSGEAAFLSNDFFKKNFHNRKFFVTKTMRAFQSTFQRSAFQCSSSAY